MLFRNLGINEVEKSQDWKLALVEGGCGSGCLIENDTNLEFRAGRKPQGKGSLVIPSLELKQSSSKGEASLFYLYPVVMQGLCSSRQWGIAWHPQGMEIPLVYLVSEFLLPVYKSLISFVAEIGKRIVTHGPRGEG